MGNGAEKTPGLIWNIEVTATANAMLADITDMRIREKIIAVIDDLAIDPDVKGKPLAGELKKFRSIRAAGQRYRVIYQCKEKTVIVQVVAVGMRKQTDKADIYRLAQKLVALGLAPSDDD